MPIYEPTPQRPTLVPIRLLRAKTSRSEASGWRPIQHYAGEIVLSGEDDARQLDRNVEATRLPESFASKATSRFGCVPEMPDFVRVMKIAEEVGIESYEYEAAVEHFALMETLAASRMPREQWPQVTAPKFTLWAILTALESCQKLQPVAVA